MDVEKLIEHLERRGLSNGSSLGPHSGLYDEAADVAEVRHGKLNFLQEDMVLCYCGVCSVCRSYVQAWNYCPNCGARMDKEN